ncbi:hypothetical protein BJY04DRAFT_212724 [Aspergillus karnatakaensis]|uniref:uncharacterized protein n=1 Tax=Aspergillus karnatakaensis TaxID=1810916 RepID=UPI003CCD4A43
MAPLAQQIPPPVTTVDTVHSPVNPSWRKANGYWTRECAGGEQAISYNQNMRDGHTELTVEVPFSANISTPELIQRVRNAWLVSHSMYPEIAVQLSTRTELPQMMKYEPLRTEADAASWLQETLHLVTDKPARDVASMTYSRRLPTRGKRNMLYLVTAPAADPKNPTHHCLVRNMSHVLADAYSIVQFYNFFFQTLTHVPGDRNLTVHDLDYSTVLGRLPVTPVTPYEDQYRPTAQHKQDAITTALGQTELYTSKMPQSIAMYPSATSASRPHKTHCIRLQYTLAESQSLLSYLRTQNLSITHAAAAATLLAVHQTYSRGHETGALLGMTRNARRWVDTTTNREEGSSVPNAADVMFLWIPFKKEWIESRAGERGVGMGRNEVVLELAQSIKSAIGPHLASPHYLSSLSFSSDRFVESLVAEGAEPVAAPVAPGFSPQGALALEREFRSTSTGGSGGVAIKTHDFVHTGRQINASPWVGMFSLWERVTLSMGFDGKYYEPETMEVFMDRVKGNLGSLVAGEESERDLGPVRAKL